LNPAVFPQPDSDVNASGANPAVPPSVPSNVDDDEINDAAVANHNVQTGLVRVRVREIELGESMSSGEFEVGKQQGEPVAMDSEGRGDFGSDDDDDENGDEWEEEGELNGIQKEEEALVRKQRPSNVVQRKSGGSEV
jgi:hypothetical protein